MGMSYLYRPFGLFFLLLVTLLGLQLVLRKPLCIESSIVYKIDKVGATGAETIYGCSQFKETLYSSYFSDKLAGLQARFEVLELQMARLNLTPRFVIEIDDVNKSQATELMNGVRIGSDLLESGRLLEKFLLKKSLKNKTNISDSIFLETVSDFLIDGAGYHNLISEAWAESFGELNFFEKLKVSRTIYRQLAGLHSADEKTAVQLLNSLTGSTKMEMVFGKKLTELGYLDEKVLAEIQFDFIIENLNAEHSLSELAALAKEFKLVRSAVKTPQGLFLLPSLLKIKSPARDGLTARHRLIFGDQNGVNVRPDAFIKNTESLVLIRPGQSTAVKFRTLYSGTVGEFLSQNKGLEFIQFHLPSYRLVYKNLGSISNYFDFVRSRDYSEKAHRLLGWSRTEWLTDLAAFRPNANYDMIQYFRVN